MIKRIASALLLVMFCHLALAVESPITVLDNIAKRVLSDLKSNRHRLHTSPQVTYSIVRRDLIPHVDVYGMSRSVLGRSVWRAANAQQRKRFTKEFTNLVIYTYAGALKDYSNETIQFYPIRGGYQGRRYLTVNSLVVRTKGRNIPMSYSVVLKGSTWKIYDMSIEGVSLLQSFRSQFATDLRTQGLERVIQRMADKNSSLR